MKKTSTQYTALALLILLGLVSPSARGFDARNYLLRFVNPNWTDVPAGTPDPNKKDSSNDPNANGSGSHGGKDGSGSGQASLGNGAGNGNGGGGASGASSYDNIGDRGGKPPGGGDTGGGSGSVAFDKWWPVCVFIDPAVPNGNAIVKGIVDKAAACHVNYVVYPITIKQSYPVDDYKSINESQKASCNLGSELNVPTWSTQVVGRGMEAPARMCESKKWENGKQIYDTNTAGCSEVGGGGSIPSGIPDGGFAKGASSGPLASILNPVGWNDKVSMHEVGHNYGLLNAGDTKGGQYTGLGLEIPGAEKNDKPPPGGVEGGGLSPNYNQLGCNFIRGKAYQNNGEWRYDPSQTEYYFNETDPQRQIQLGEPVFGNTKLPPTSPPVFMGGGKRPDADDVEKLSYFDDLKKGQGEAPLEDTRHKKKPGGGAVDALLASLKKSKRPVDDDEAALDNATKLPGGGGKPSDEARLFYDDGLKKGDGEDLSSSGVGSSSANFSSSGEGGGGDSASLSYDDSLAKGEGMDPVSSVGRKDRDLASTDVLKGLSDPKKKKEKKDKEEDSDDGFFRSAKKIEKPRLRVKGDSLRSNQSKNGPNP